MIVCVTAVSCYSSKGFNGTPAGAQRLSTVSAKDKAVDDDPDRKERWRSLWLATIILFLVSVQFSIYFSSLWPYLQVVCTVHFLS